MREGTTGPPDGTRVGGIRRREVLEEAAALFDRVGYHSTTVEDIARAVGIRKATIYHYFRSKDEILMTIHGEFIDPLISRHEMRLRVDMTPQQHVLEFMADMLETIDTRRGHVRVFFEHYRELPPAAQAAVAVKRDRYQSMVEDIIRRGIGEGVFKPVDVRLATLALFGMCNWAHQWHRHEGPLRAREIAYQFWQLFLRGIEVQEAQPG